MLANCCSIHSRPPTCHGSTSRLGINGCLCPTLLLTHFIFCLIHVKVVHFMKALNDQHCYCDDLNFPFGVGITLNKVEHVKVGFKPQNMKNVRVISFLLFLTCTFHDSSSTNRSYVQYYITYQNRFLYHQSIDTYTVIIPDLL